LLALFGWLVVLLVYLIMAGPNQTVILLGFLFCFCTIGFLLFGKGNSNTSNNGVTPGYCPPVTCQCQSGNGVQVVTYNRQDMLPYVPRPFIKRTQEEMFEKLRRHEIHPKHWPWHYYESTYECTMGEDRIGHAGWDDGGKWICGMSNLLQRPNCVIYSMGSNGQHDFEDDLLANTKCEIHTFDMDDFSKVFNGTRVHFHKSKIGNGKGGTKSISQWMKELGHDHLDVLKTDIEMAEYDAYEDLAKQDPQPWIGQILMEMHLNSIPWAKLSEGDKYKWIDKQIRLLENIHNLGLVQYHREDNPFGVFCTEFCFGQLRPRPQF